MIHSSSYLCVEYKIGQSKWTYWLRLTWTLNLYWSYCTIWEKDHILTYNPPGMKNKIHHELHIRLSSVWERLTMHIISSLSIYCVKTAIKWDMHRKGKGQRSMKSKTTTIKISWKPDGNRMGFTKNAVAPPL